MKILNFKYTKAAGKVSQRSFLPINAPTNNYFGIDISELSQEEQADFVINYEKLQLAFLENVEKLMKEFDIATMYRSFIPEKMEDITADEL